MIMTTVQAVEQDYRVHINSLHRTSPVYHTSSATYGIAQVSNSNSETQKTIESSADSMHLYVYKKDARLSRFPSLYTLRYA